MSTEEFKRRLTAILSADVEGYSRLMREDEEATIRTLKAFRTAMGDLIGQYRGRVVDSPGDNLLAEFVSVLDAVNCAVEIQRELAERNTALPESRRMRFRIGVNLGDIVEDGERIYGDGVNIAARMESLAEGGGICISGTVYDQVKHKLGLEYEYQGEQEVKNIPEPVRAYMVLSFPGAAAHRVAKAKKAVGKTWRNAIATIAAVLVVGAAVAVWYFYFRAPPMEPVSEKDMAFPLPDKPSIAVLPFSNIGDPEQEYIADGITEQIITALARNPLLFVIASNSTFTYKGKPVKVQQVSRELGVHYVVEGSVQRSGERIRITAQLVDATRGKHLWADNYDRNLKDIFALQDEIAVQILKATMGKLLGREDLYREKGTTHIGAYLKFLKARTLVATNEPNNRLCRQMLEECIALDPAFAMAYSVLGMSYFVKVFNGWSQSPGKDMTKAYELAKKAIVLDQTLVHPHATLGWIYLQQGKHDEAVAEGKKAVGFVPNSAFANYQLGAFLTFADRTDEAILVVKKALRLNPFPSDWQLWFAGNAYFFAGRYEEALVYTKKSQKQNPENMWAYSALASTYGLLGREQEAHAAAKELLRLNPKFSIAQQEKAPWHKNREKWKVYINGLRKAGLAGTKPLPLPDKPSIAVLPFVNMSGDPKQEYFSDGITEEIITGLAKVPNLFVIARNSVFTYKGRAVKVQQVGRELGVRYVLEGSVRKSGGRVRITVQLIDAKTGKHEWAERYDRELKDIFALQDEITMKIMTALRIKLTEGEQARLIGKGAKNLEAYAKVLQARTHFYRMNKQGSMEARRLAKEAVVLDPEYSVPYTILALTHMMDLWFRFSKTPKESMGLAIDAAQKSLSLDDSDPATHIGLCMLYIMQRKHDMAIAAAKRAVELSPSGANAYSALGTALRYAGRPNEAIAMVKKAISLNPISNSILLRNLGISLHMVGRYQEAIVSLKKSLKDRPNDLFTHLYLAVTYISLGRQDEARAESKEVLRIHPKFSLEHFAKTLPYKDQSLVDNTIARLRKAGLPE